MANLFKCQECGQGILCEDNPKEAEPVCCGLKAEYLPTLEEVYEAMETASKLTKLYAQRMRMAPEQISNELFENGNGDKADRLVLELPGKKDGGGWCKVSKVYTPYWSVYMSDWRKDAELVQRVSVPELDAILGKPFPVLDDGFIRVMDYMGGDASVVQSARVSYGKGTKKVSEDAGLIRYLLRHHHSTPFKMPEIRFHVRVPMDCWRQWIRHRMSSTNEYSTRYSEAIDSKAATRSGEWRLQSTSNKQGSGEFLDVSVGEPLSNRESELHRLSALIYEERLDSGVAREQARKDLPLSTYTEAYWKIDLHNLLHFLRLRMDSHAQLEIRSYANVIGDIVHEWCPMTWEAFEDYRLNSMAMSARDTRIANALSHGRMTQVAALCREFGWISFRDDGSLKSNRELSECISKMKVLGLTLNMDTLAAANLHEQALKDHYGS